MPTSKGKTKIADFRPQQANTNLHTPRGMAALDNVIASDGWIGAMTVTADGETIDGSARLETAYNRFGEEVEPIVIRSKGDRPIIHIREDIPNAEDPRAKRLGVAANRIAELNLSYDAELLDEIAEEVDLSDLFSDEELSQLDQDFQIEQEQQEQESEEPLNLSGREKYPLAIVLSSGELAEWKIIKESLGEKQDTKAFLKLMRGNA